MSKISKRFASVIYPVKIFCENTPTNILADIYKKLIMIHKIQENVNMGEVFFNF